MIHFWLGVAPERIEESRTFLKEKGIEVIDEYDDPNGYYTFSLKGSWENYDECCKEEFMCSIEHYEE